MFTVIYVTAVLVSLALQRQERRHLFELGLVYYDLGKELPPLQPRLPKLESWLNILVSFYVFLFGALMLWANLLRLSKFGSSSRFSPEPLAWDMIATMLATGIALMILGILSLKHHRDFEKTQELK